MDLNNNTKYPLDCIQKFKEARLTSYLSEGKNPGRRMGAVLHHGNRSLSFGVNLFNKTHTLQMHYPLKQFLHAEINALIKRRHCDDLSSCQITVYRETYDGIPALAKPCDNCQTILKSFGIKKIYYSTPIYPYWDVLKL